MPKARRPSRWQLGASPETVATSVASSLERYLGKIANVTEMTSQSDVGQTRIVLQFGALGLFARRRGCRSCSRISSPSATRLTERANCRASSPTPFEADAVPHNPRYKQKNRHHRQDNTDIPPYCRQPAQRLPRGPVLAVVNEAGVVAQAVAGSLRVTWAR